MPRVLQLIFVCLFFSTLSGFTESARILGFFATPSKSHLIIHSAITEILAERGHNVTVVTTIPLIRKHPRYRHIQLSVPGFPPNFLSDEIKSQLPFFLRIKKFVEFLTGFGNATLNQPEVKKLMDEESFDLFILGCFGNDFALGIANKFKSPVIMSFGVRPTSSVHDLVGNPQEISTVPSLLLGLKQPMGFIDRVKNFIFISAVEKLLFNFILDWYQADVYRANFPPDKYPSFENMKKNVSLILTNHHFSQGPIRPDVPAIVEVGGIQIKEKPDPLPEDLKSILDNSTKHGLIYFSLGSNVRGSNLDKAKVTIMFNVLSKLPQTVLWKWDESFLPGQSTNIIYKSWLPQDDILSHPNVKLFITHGGQGSVVESQYHGVPMVGIPLFGEQSSNMENVVKEGFGLSVNYHTLSEDTFSSALNEVLENKKYSEKVKRFARLYKDRPMSARETAAFWIEYVLRHNGAPHLQSPAIHLNWFQRSSLDVIGFLLAIIYIVWKVIKITFSFIREKLKNEKSKKE